MQNWSNFSVFDDVSTIFYTTPPLIQTYDPSPSSKSTTPPPHPNLRPPHPHPNLRPLPLIQTYKHWSQ